VSARLQLELEKDAYKPGDTVRGTIVVVEGGPSRRLEALLEYWETTSGYRELVISISSGPLHEGDLTTGTSFAFELGLPENASPNHASANGELYWQVDARSDEFGRDTHQRARIAVATPRAAPALENVAATPSPQPDESQTGLARDAGRGEGLSSTIFRWAWLVFLAFGVAALIGSVVTLVLAAQFVAGAERATGTVVDFDVTIDSEGDETFYPVVRFATADGNEIVFTSSSGSYPPSQSPGDRVDVLYDPDDPDDARLSGFFDLWGVPGIAFVLGAVFIAVGLFLRRRMR
jgi:hypothetical protein